MDIVAHTLWAGVGVAVLHRGQALTRRTALGRTACILDSAVGLVVAHRD